MLMGRSGLRWEHVIIDILHCVDQAVMSRVAANALLRGHDFWTQGTSLPEQIKHVSDDLRRWYAAKSHCPSHPKACSLWAVCES